jgi:signal transduction histidine kinase
VSEDVSLAQPPGRLSRPTRPDAGSQPPAWRRYLWLWETYFAAVGVVAVVAIQLDSAGTSTAAVATGLVAALAGWYLALGRRLIRVQESGFWWWRLGYQVGVLALLVPAVLLAPASSLVMFALLPQAMMMWPLLPAVGSVLALLAGTWVVAPTVRATGRPSVAGSLDLLLMLGLVAVLSIYINRIAQQSSERAELIAQLAASRAEVSRLSHEAGVAAERQRLAGDIHDTIAQGLSSVVMLVQSADAALERDPAAACRHLALALRAARDNLAEARALVAALTPPQLDGASLPEALRRLPARGGIPVTVSVDGTPRPVPTPVEVVLLRAAQEALTNAGKHAAAGQVVVRLWYDRDAVTLEVSDDGTGFDTGRLGDGYGLGAMRARVSQVDGELAVDSAPGAGTTVRVTVPA